MSWAPKVVWAPTPMITNKYVNAINSSLSVQIKTLVIKEWS